LNAVKDKQPIFFKIFMKLLQGGVAQLKIYHFGFNAADNGPVIKISIFG
jgi:hypothetical protein